jgi:hypothetical protein
MLVIYDGIKHISGQYYFVLKNELGQAVEIPVEKRLADHIKLYVGKIAPPEIKEVVERGNDEASE